MSDKTPSSPLAPGATSPTNETSSTAPVSWASVWRVYAERATLRMLLLGFSAGLPLLLVLGTLSFRLREAGINRTTIGYLSWVGLAYGFKWIWAPLIDRLPIPLVTSWLGRRRSWLLFAQALVIVGLVGMALTNPQKALEPLVWFAVLVAFGSATQDIALDAYRIESADTSRQAALSAAYQTGYRIAMIWAGAGVFWVAAISEVVGADSSLSPACIADNGLAPAISSTVAPIAQAIGAAYHQQSWQIGYLVMAASMLVGVITVIFSPEPKPQNFKPTKNAAEWLKSALIDPFADFIARYRWHAALLLGLISIYRISDVVMGIMAYPFYADMCYTKLEVANITKVFGVIMTLVGAFIGGAMAMRLGVMRVLMLGAILSAGSNLLFAWLGTRGHDVNSLVFVISADNLSSGIASAAFIAYLSSLTNVNYSATQYALFSSMMLLLPKFIAGYSGKYVDTFGYSHFFTATALLGLPVLLLVALASRIKTPASQ